MKQETFINKLLSVGFVQNSNDGASNWYENYSNGASVFVGIMGEEIITVFKEVEEIEFEKDYLTYSGAWNAIKKII